MNNWFILVVGFVEACAGIQCLINGKTWLGMMWLSYTFSCICLYMEGR